MARDLDAEIRASHEFVKARLKEKGWSFGVLAERLKDQYDFVYGASRCLYGISDRTIGVRVAIGNELGFDANKVWPPEVMSVGGGTEAFDGTSIGWERTARAASDVFRLMKEKNLTALSISEKYGIPYSSLRRSLMGHGRQDEHRKLVASLLGEDPSDLWPQLYSKPVKVESILEGFPEEDQIKLALAGGMFPDILNRLAEGTD